MLAVDRSGSAGLKEEDYTREALTQATTFLDRAETAYKKDPKDREVVQFARTAAQSAENARALAMGAVGGLLVRQLENEVASLREELARLKSARPADPATAGAEVHTPADRPAPTPSSSQLAPVPLAVVNATPLVKQPALWFAVAGWALALILLFRRRTI